MVIEKPRLIYEIKVERRKHIRRFFWGAMFFVILVAATFLLDAVELPPQLDSNLVLVGKIVALGLGTIYLVRGIFALLRGLGRRDETIRIFDRGFAWTRKGETHKYSWLQLQSYREGFRRAALGRFVLFQTGKIILKMKDGNTYTLTPVHGNLEEISNAISPFIEEITGTRLGQVLRDGKSVKVHPNLTIAPQGIRAGKENISWKNLDIGVKGRKLVVSRVMANGTIKTVARYPSSKIDNLSGFLDIARSTIQNHQPERFGIQTQIGVTYIE